MDSPLREPSVPSVSPWCIWHPHAGTIIPYAALPNLQMESATARKPEWAMVLAALLGFVGTWHYTVQNIEGWTVKVGDSAIADTRSWPSAKLELQRQLQNIARIVPDEPLAQLRKVVIYVNAKTETGCMAFHPGAGWLREHGMDPDMAGNVEIGNLANFVSWTYQQPWMVMHELAHAYDFKVLGKGQFGHAVDDAFNSAVKSKRYEDVLYYDGHKSKHYAMNNTMEFFAEMTEAYFGTNDIYPFVQAELKTYDPETFAALEKAWGKPVKRE